MQMQPTDWSQTPWTHRALALGLAVLLLGSVFAAVATAQPAIGFRTAEVSETTVTVGENVTVSAEAVNVGDSGGGYTFTFEHNGTDLGTGWVQFAEQRVTVPANGDRRVTANVSFDRPGTYRVRVSENRAGVVTVRSSRAQVASTSDSQRRIDVRATGVSETEPTDFDIPASNRTFTLQRWSPTTGEATFQQYLTEYTERADVPGTLPARATLVGVVEFESDDQFGESTMRVAVNDSVLANATLGPNEVTVYQRDGDVWEPLSTNVVAERRGRTVYEATATRGTTYAVGRMEPDISVGNTSVRTAGTATGQSLTLTGELRNDGPVPGTFVGTLRVNGAAVNQTSVTVPAGGETNITLSHEVTEAGTYDLRLNSSVRSTVVIADSQVGTPQSTGTAASSDGVGGGQVPDGVPATVLGINTLYVAGGVAIALGAFVALFLLLRRGGDGGGGLPDTFDPF